MWAFLLMFLFLILEMPSPTNCATNESCGLEQVTSLFASVSCLKMWAGPDDAKFISGSKVCYNFGMAGLVTVWSQSHGHPPTLFILSPLSNHRLIWTWDFCLTRNATVVPACKLSVLPPSSPNTGFPGFVWHFPLSQQVSDVLTLISLISQVALFARERWK